MKMPKGFPTGRGYPIHIALSLRGGKEWELSCGVCQQSVLNRSSHGRGHAARFLRWHKHCGLLRTLGGRVNG